MVRISHAAKKAKESPARTSITSPANISIAAG